MAITNGYATLAELKATLRITDMTDDTLLENAIESSSRLIDGYSSRQFWTSGTATSRIYNATDDFQLMMDDVSGTAGFVLKSSSMANQTYDVTWAATDFQIEPLNGVLDGQYWPFDRVRACGRYLFPTINTSFTLAALVQVTATWGWASVPSPIKQATLLQAARIYRRYDSPLGVAGFGDFGVVRVSRFLDPDVQQLVEPYRRLRNFA